MYDTSSAVLALLGGTAFRLVLSFTMDRVKEYQDHRFEMQSIKLQDHIEESRSNRHMKILQIQKDLGLEQVGMEIDRSDSLQNMVNFQEAVADVKKPTGFLYLDMLNSSIRPGLAIFCIVIWGLHLYHKNWILSSWDLELIAATLGIFIGSRIASTGK